jgi:hypothetical protein
MIKFLIKLFKNKSNIEKYMAAEERYILSQDPQNIRDIEYFSEQYSKMQNQRRSWSIL